jgi:pyridoxal phosphate enzyme (YggS family)
LSLVAYVEQPHRAPRFAQLIPESRLRGHDGFCINLLMPLPADIPADTPAARLAAVRARIEAALSQSDRPTDSVTLLGVSKAQPAVAIRALADEGLLRFGESYLAEATAKQRQLADLPIEWHFIGRVQSNKTREIAARFSWVHSLDSARIAQRLNDQRPPGLPPLNVCLQVNLDHEATKAGLPRAATLELVPAVHALPRLRLRGLMAIPKPREGFNAQRAAFAAVRELYETLRARRLPLDILSMGMSDDLEAAIAEGATLVRIGTALFGPRRTTGNGKWETGNA